jgi:hypothetical protein
MRVEPAKQASSDRSSGARRDTAVAPAEHDANSRALTVIAPAAAQKPSVNYRQSRLLAPFLAQLIATKDQLPQTRERRRAEPAEAIAAYRATAARTEHN